MTVEPQALASTGGAGLDSVVAPETEVEVKKPLLLGSYSGATTAVRRQVEGFRARP